MTSAPDEGGEEPRTVFVPRSTTVDPGTSATPLAGSTPSDHITTVASVTTPLRDGARVQAGDVLNHIYEVKRFVARGGMGEVYEGINLHTEEQVAIKVILPALAADPNVQAMFRKEAKTLTRLSHPALVQYRVLAQEPQLGLLYIVTDFISGSKLSDVLGTISKDADSMATLLRHLAEGLRAAHQLGAVHRDIAPDNVMLEGERLNAAKIIDFGIAKDLDASKGTIVGDGFAGKLNYVAPEQLGDFGRDVGAWSDVYSLGLLMLAVARGRDVDMGATLVDAVDKRRAGIDVSAAPPILRPVLSAMLVADPGARLRSMDQVISALDAALAGMQPRHTGAQTVDAHVARPAAAGPSENSMPIGAVQTGALRNRRLVIGGGLACLLIAGAIGAMMIPKGDAPSTPVPSSQPQTAAAGQSLDAAARSTILAALPGIGCSWLDLQGLSGGTALSARFSGVAGDTAAAQGALSSATMARDVSLASIDFDDVAPIQASACPALDAYRSLKSPAPGNLVTDQVKYEMATAVDGDNAGQSIAIPQVHISAAALAEDIAILGVETDGTITEVIPDKKTLLSIVANPQNGSVDADGAVTLKVAQGAEGWSGLLAIQGKGPFPSELVAPPPSERGPAWRAQLASAAKSNGWKADMVWFKVVNEVPDSS